MALITDPDLLGQGLLTNVTDLAVSASAGQTCTWTSAGANLPSASAGEYIELRDHSDINNNGLYEIVTYTSASDIDLEKIGGTAPANQSAEDANVFGADDTPTGISSTYKTVHVDTENKHIYLLPLTASNLIAADGATGQALYSFLKEEWKNDDFLNPHDFPMIAITPEQFEFIFDWEPVDEAVSPTNVTTRKSIRSAGWSEIDTADSALLKSEYIGVITLGTFEDSGTDTAYYQLGTDPTITGAGVDFSFPGPVNEAIRTYDQVTPLDSGTGFDFSSTTQLSRNDGGNWVTDGYVVGGQITITDAEDVGNNNTFTLTVVGGGVDGELTIDAADFTLNSDDVTMKAAVDNRQAIKLFLRIRDADPNGKIFAASDLAGIGVTTVTNQAYRFPVTNSTDLKISATDASITGGGPWDQIEIRYFDQDFNRDVDSATNRAFGIVIDVGTHSGVDGVTAGGATLTSAEGGIKTDASFTGGTITCLDQTDEGTVFTISGTPTATVVTITSTFTGSDSALSFVIQRATPIVATIQQIYEKVQWSLRQAADIDETGDIVTGKTGDALLRFVGDAMEAGQAAPVNPNGGGSGVMIEGFDSNDTNRLTFFDNTATSRTFPFVAAGSLNFNDNLVADGVAEFWMFFTYTERFTNAGFGLSSSSGDAATLDSSVTVLTTELSDGDYINLTGFTTQIDNGIFVLTGAPAGGGPYTAAVRKVNGDTLIDEAESATVSLDKHPLNSADALIVDDNGGTPIKGTVGGPSVSFDFDYDNNNQGGRDQTDAVITLRAIGFDTAQFVETGGTITRATGLSFSLVAGLERNYLNV